MKRTLYTVPANGGAAVSFIALMPTRRVEIEEDDSGTNQGLAIKFLDDNFTQVYEFAPGHEPIILGNVSSNFKGKGPIVGLPAQTVAVDPGTGDGGGNFKTIQPATIYCKVTAMGQNATKVRVTEYA